MHSRGAYMLFTIIMIVFLAVFAGLFYSSGKLTIYWFQSFWSSINKNAMGVLYGAVTAIIILIFGFSHFSSRVIPLPLIRISYYAMGVLIYHMMIINAGGVVLLLYRLFSRSHLVQNSLGIIIAGALVMTATAGVSIYGIIHAKRFQTAAYNVNIGRGLDTGNSMRIALISDIHLGHIIDTERLNEMIASVNESQPDLVCIAGDIFDGSMESIIDEEGMKAAFERLNAPFGVYACLGNHDAGDDWQKMLEFLSESSVTVLLDQTVVIDNRIILGGRRDSSPIGNNENERTGLLDIPELEMPVIVMDHQPSNLKEYGEEVDLLLSGHTHKGQMFPFNLITKAIFTIDYGYLKESDSSPASIVTSGAGTWGPPLRVASDSEIVVINVNW